MADCHKFEASLGHRGALGKPGLEKERISKDVPYWRGCCGHRQEAQKWVALRLRYLHSSPIFALLIYFLMRTRNTCLTLISFPERVPRTRVQLTSTSCLLKDRHYQERGILRARSSTWPAVRPDTCSLKSRQHRPEGISCLVTYRFVK